MLELERFALLVAGRTSLLLFPAELAMSKCRISRFASSRCVVISILASAGTALAVQFPTLDPNYNQQIYVAPLIGGPAAAWTSAGNMLTRNGSQIYEYSLTQNVTINGTNLHGTIATHTPPGLSGSGYAMTNAPDGFIYVNAAGSGLQRINPNNWSQPAVSLGGNGGGGYSINALQNGKIVYSDTAFTSTVTIYDPTANSHTPIYTMPTGVNVDDIEAGPGNIIALAGQTGPQITIINQTGGLINQFSTPATSYPDGLAFGAPTGLFGNSIYSNNNDGSITRFDFPNPGYTGTPTVTYIAKGAGTNNVNGPGAYGDLAAVGPDCAFYVYNGPNGGANFSAIAGTRWDDGTLTLDGCITRIAIIDPLTGAEDCGFYSVLEPEPTSLSALVFGASLLRRRR